MNEKIAVKKRIAKRIPLESVSFSDFRGEVSGFASGWYFWVHKAFKDALDIRFVERIERGKTAELRERMSLERTNLSLVELRRRKADSVEYAKAFQLVMRASHKVLLETESTSPIYTFGATDAFESRCGKWYIQVTRENSERFVGEGDDTKISYDELGVVIYRRSTEPGALWESDSSANLQQSELVELLKLGRAATVDLAGDDSNFDAVVQLHLF